MPREHRCIMVIDDVLTVGVHVSDEATGSMEGHSWYVSGDVYWIHV